MNLRALASDSALYAFARVTAVGGQLVVVPIWTHALSRAEFGLNALLAYTATLFAIIAVSGFDNGMWSIFYDRKEPEQRQMIASFFWTHVAASLGLAVVALVSARWWSSLLPGADAVLLAVLAVQALVASAQVVFQNWARAVRRPQLALAVSLAHCGATVAAQWTFVSGMHLGLRGVWLGQLAVAAVMSAVVMVLMRGWWHPRSFRLSMVRQMWPFAWPVIPAGVAAWIVAAAGSFFLQVHSGGEHVADFRLAALLSTVVGVATSAFQQAWTPFFLSVQSRPDHRELYARAFLVYVCAIGLACATVSLFAPELALVLAPRSYGESVEVVPLLCFSSLVAGMTPLAVTAFVLAKRPRPLGLVLTAASLFSLILNVVLVPRWGQVGAGAAALISQILGVGTLFVLGQRAYRIPFPYFSGVGVVVTCAAVAWIGLERFGERAPTGTSIRFVLWLALGAGAAIALRQHLQGSLRTSALASRSTA